MELKPTIVCFDPAQPDKPCPICGGKGVIKYDVPLEHPRFGKLFRCSNYPLEADHERQARLRRLSNLGAFSHQTLHNFVQDPDGYTDRESQSLQIAHRMAEAYARNPDGWMLLEGSYGCGKTHLAAAVGNERLAQGDVVLFVTTPDLLDHLRAAYSPTAESSYDETFERVRTTDLLILDDLGVENPSAWAQEKLFQLLNYRYSHRKATIITTNADIDALDPRIRSRLLDTQLIRRVTITAPDYRSLSKNNNDELLSRLPLYRDMVFERFDVSTNLSMENEAKLRQAAEKAFQYARQPQGWMVFIGAYGSGKTHLAAAIANFRQSQGEQVMFVTAPDLLDYLRTTFGPNANTTFDVLFDRVRNVPLLVLDDLATQHARSWAKEKLFQLLDYRYVAKLPTVITSSEKLDDMEERILSRILDARTVQRIAITTPSYGVRMFSKR